ncbi:MAG: Ig-like domain-containing protein [Planctomycetota bacterium]|jgi:DNA-binding beta-propeller fold protein YncE
MNARHILKLGIVLSLLVFPWASESAVAEQVVAWGRNTYGQCDVPEGDDFVATAAGDGHSLALRSDGSLLAWGYGECDVPEGKDFVAIAAHGPYRIALRSDGSLVGWGHYKDDRCDVPEGNNFVAIAAGETHAVALRSDGSLVQWDYKGDHIWSTPPQGSDFVAVAAGDRHSLALKSDGTVAGWGDNSDGQCDAPQGVRFTAIAAGTNNSFGITSRGSILTWGYRQKRGTARLPRGNDFVSIASRRYYNMALKSDGSIVVWKSKQGVVSDNYFTAIAPGLDHDLALARNPQPHADRQRPLPSRRRPNPGAPVADDICVSTSEDSQLQIQFVGRHPNGDALEHYAYSRPQHGKLSDNREGPNITYTPYANYYGLDRFTYYVSDADKRQSSYATVDIAVTPVPDKPVAHNIRVSAIENTPVEIDLSGIDFDGDSLTYAVESQPENGTLELIDTTHNINLYSPNPDFRGKDLFTFVANDGREDSNAAKVDIEVFRKGFELNHNRDEEVCAMPILEPLQVDSPVDLAVDRQGNLYILCAGPGRSRVLICNDQLEVKQTITIDADNPRGIALDQDKFYITDTGRNRILRYARDGSLDTSFGENGLVGRSGTGEGEFNQPWGIAVGREHKVYVTDSGNNRVQIFDANGKFLSQWRQTTKYDRRSNFVPQSSRYSHEEMEALIASSLRGITSLGQVRAADRQPISNPTGFYLRPSRSHGDIFLADTANNRVKRLSSDSSYLLAGVGGEGDARGRFNSPADVYYDPEFDQLLVADAGNNRIQLFILPSSGSYLGPQEITYLQEIADQNFSGPMAVATASEKSTQIIYVADTGNNRVLKLENNIEIPRKPSADVVESAPQKLKLTVRETFMLRFDPDEVAPGFAISPDHKRIAYRHLVEGSRGYVVVDGVKQKLYDAFPQGCVFSPDSKRLAYITGQKDRKSFVVLDGVELADGYTGIGNLTFSPDSQRFAYEAEDDDTGKEFVFLDGQRSKGHYGISWRHSLVFSPDGRRLAYIAHEPKKSFVVVDSFEGKRYDDMGSGPVFTSDGKYVRYVAKKDEQWFIVTDAIDGTESKTERFVDSLPLTDPSDMQVVFSPDGRRVAYPAMRRQADLQMSFAVRKMCMVADGVKQKEYDGVEQPVFSPDSKRLAYTAFDSERFEHLHFVVVDGREGKRYEVPPLTNLDESSLKEREGMVPRAVFSPDSKKLAYVASYDDGAVVVVNDVEGPKYQKVWPQSLVFSPDSKRVAYWAVRGDDPRIVIDGQDCKESVGTAPVSKLAFDRPNVLHTVVLRGQEFLRIEVKIAER